MKKLIFGIVLTALVVLGVLTASASAVNGPYAPKGNNGTVKISDSASPDGIPDNNPHVSCGFNVEFYNYDTGSNKAVVNFALHSPTTGNGYTMSVTGNTQPIFNGGKGLNASEHYTLGFTGQAHPKQGYHVKLTVNIPGSKGADKKHKVFWVQPCTSSTPGTVAPPTNTGNQPQVSNASTATSIPNTGAGSTIAIFAGVSMLAGVSHYTFNRRRL